MQQTNEDKAQLILRIDQMLEDHRFDKERYGVCRHFRSSDLLAVPLFFLFTVNRVDSVTDANETQSVQ